jgi:hypothetical protein
MKNKIFKKKYFKNFFLVVNKKQCLVFDVLLDENLPVNLPEKPDLDLLDESNLPPKFDEPERPPPRKFDELALRKSTSGLLMSEVLLRNTT